VPTAEDHRSRTPVPGPTRCLTETARWLAALVLYYGVKLDEARSAWGRGQDNARELHESAVLEV
jgi:hypothetical protein